MVKAYKYLFTQSLIITIFLLIIIVLLNKKQKELNDNEIEQYKSFKLSNELRNSSDELTHYCRTYVLTGDSIWEEKYQDLLDARDDNMIIPSNEEINLINNFSALNFSKEEIEVFNLAKKNSQDLVEVELEAFKLVKNISDSNKYSDLNKAKRIIFDENYSSAKENIRNLINDFNRKVDSRIMINIIKAKNQVEVLTYILMILIVTLIASLIFFLVLIQNKVKEQKQHERDLKEAKKEAEESDKFKSIFLANMSHEFRTPLNAIIGFGTQLKSFYKDDPIYQKYIRIVESSGKHLSNLINDVLEISRIEANKLKVNKSTFFINELLEEMHELFKEYNNNLGKSDEVKILLKKDSSDFKIDTDETKLRQVLTNLVNNAIKFTNKGSIEFGYHVKLEDKNIEFFVKDTGIGIPDQQMKTIFKRFLQTNQTIDENEKGTGLGLEISQAIIKALGGDIWVESELNIGSLFYFTIPISENIENITLEKKKETIIKPSISRKILIAEDSDVNYLLLKLYLKEKKHELIRANNGLEAIEIVKNDPTIEVILMDVRMPKLNGWEATEEIKKINPDIPIIIQTANSFDSDKDESIRVGANDFISKPITKEELLKKIDQLFK